MNTLKLLSPEDFKVLKLIKIIGPEWNKFTGYLPYLRKLEFQSEMKEGEEYKDDIVDEKMILALRNNFPKSESYSRAILFEGQLDQYLKAIKGGTEKGIIIQFNPLIPYHEAPRLVGQTFHAYPINFNLRLNAVNKEKIEFINDYFLCDIPYNDLDDIVKTIEPA